MGCLTIFFFRYQCKQHISLEKTSKIIALKRYFRSVNFKEAVGAED